jgi:hypothetical protein
VKILKSVEFYLYTAVASGVMVWASHNPIWHDPALWLMGVLGHAIGFSSGKSGADGVPAP